MRAKTLCLLALVPALGFAAGKSPIQQPWPMHHVCRDFLIANSLNAADVDGDGFDDYSVIDERRGLMTVIFHPGKAGQVRKEWPRLILGKTGNPEYACLPSRRRHRTSFTFSVARTALGWPGSTSAR